MKYEIRRDSEVQEDSPSEATIKFREPKWIVYFEDRKNLGPAPLKGFSKLEEALRDFINGIGMEEGIVRVIIETRRELGSSMNR